MPVYKWLTPENTMLAVVEGGHTVIVEPGHPDWDDTSVRGDIEPLPVTPLPTAVELLAAERAGMIISPMQGILTLGEANWGIIRAYRETASWAERVIIDSAQDWERNSQNIAFFGYLLDFTDDDMDTLFRAAALVRA